MTRETRIVACPGGMTHTLEIPKDPSILPLGYIRCSKCASSVRVGLDGTVSVIPRAKPKPRKRR